MTAPTPATARDAAHTPGPWHLEWRLGDGDKSSFISADDERIFEYICIIPHDDVTEDGVPVIHANARLIAAAPGTAAERDRLMAINGELVAALRLAEEELAFDHK